MCNRKAKQNSQSAPPLFQILIALFAFMGMATTTLVGQSTQGNILGSVADANGAFVSNAAVTVTSLEEGVSQSTTSDQTGSYQIINLKPGHYKLVVKAEGFDQTVINNLNLTARQQMRVNVSLKVGSVQSQVTVSADAAGVITTETASITAAFSATDVQSLPANYRASSTGTSPLKMIQTLPGVQADTASNDGSTPKFSIQGGLPFQAEVSVDGVTTQSTTGNSPLANAFPSGESIQEMRVDGVLNNAEFGQPGEVTTISKSGSNAFHGSAFWYHQNQAFNAVPYGATTKPHLVGNDYGASAGGPVRIPHLYNGKDKSFFFGTFEGFRNPRSTPKQYVVPSTLMKKGVFNFLPANSLKNPYTGGTYANNTVPLNSVSEKFMQFFPDPNQTDPSVYKNDGTPNYIVNKDAAYISNQFDVRGDQYLGSKGLVFGRFTWKNIDVNNPQTLLVPTSKNQTQDRMLILAFNYNFTPKIINEFRFGFTLDTAGNKNSFDGPGFIKTTGLEGLQNLFFNGISEVGFNTLTSLDADRLTSVTKSRTYQFGDHVSFVLGHHNLKVGTDVRKIEAITPLGFFGADNYGTFDFSSAAFTGHEFADFLIGTPNNTQYDQVAADNDGKTMHYHFYGQDEWKATPNLTVSYGLRYEFHPAYNDPTGNIGNFDPSVAKSGRVVYPDGKANLLSTDYLSSFNACGVGQSTGVAAQNGAACTPVLSNSQAGLPSGLKTVPKLRFLPRLGFAYRPFGNDKTAIRGGFGIYNITLLGGNFYSLTGTLQAYTVQYNNTQTTSGPAFAWPKISAGSGLNSNAASYGSAYFGTANDVTWKDPYSEQWSLSVDRDLSHGYGARVSYIGMVTRQLVWAPNLNDLPYSKTTSAYAQPLSARPFPNWGVINTRSTGANSSYNALQLDLSRRLSNGLQFNTDYTYAKSLADNQGPNSTSFAGETGGARASYNFDRAVDYGNMYGTRRHRWISTMIWDLPVGRGKAYGNKMSRWADLLVGGWRMSNIFLLQSGPYLTAYFPSGQGDPSGTGSGLSSGKYGSLPGRSQHVDQVGSAKPSNQNRNNWINVASFRCPGDSSWVPGTACHTGGDPSKGYLAPIGRFGNSKVGAIVGPGTLNLSTGLSKTFSLTERVRLQAEGTFTNILNHTNLSDPALDVSKANFGKITTARGSDFGGNRNGQVSMRLMF